MAFPVVRRPRPNSGAPASVEGLPFVLLRDALVTRDPELVAAAIEHYQSQEQERDIYGGPVGPYALPQKMQFQQWKTPPMSGGANRPRHADPYAPAAGLMQLRADQIAMERDLIRANNPEVYPIEHAGFDRSGSDTYEPVDTRELLVRDAPAEGRPIYPYPYPTADEEIFGADEVEAPGPYTQGIQHSLAEVRALQGQLLGWIAGDVRGRR